MPCASLASSLKHKTVAPFWVEYLLDAALRAGVDLSYALVASGISNEDLEDPQSRISMAIENQLLSQAIADSADPLFGLHMGEGIRPRFMGELGYASMSSATLGDAIELMIPFMEVTTEYAQLRFEWREYHGDKTLCLMWESDLEALPTYPARVDANFAAAIIYGRWLIGQELNPTQILFKHSPQGDETEYQRIFRCNVSFGQPENAIVLPAHMLDLPLRDADPEVHKVARSRMQRAVTQYHARDNLLEQVRLEIQNRLQQGVPQLEPIADQLGIKPWTLRRQLRAENTDFSSLLEDERRRLACDWLLHSERSVNQIALDLGYSEQSAFNRAFKRWFSITPVQYRSHQGHQPFDN
ncbi:MAG: AraC family transcriptional regulator [Alcanivorax borkumensis]|jgi:AraC-like DNA-binding protein|uniref:Transcriptional regulator, AraC family n=1 Tax=Alcanivorax borkumensis (strain ATCC 700651 / DSM 11573 / NCIMB 13689 / SK2) TaxID=393595 RepID=Q0VQ50_ALCBS|nr:AraC family transcriptional regulator [Alcanivorax sp. 97CO-5]OJH07843.1 MAG: AraC family transcriptional regulator [Alcanivorax borkumensis]PKG02742.1 AraC family transcriptional regulator [Alcanivorax sp. 97CO-6]CAL16698.1 transcriptional regulator, AraC family [Alcanivorax borkumensis SK2]